MKTFLNAVKKYFADFGRAVAKGDIWCKLSLIILGAGYFGRKQIIKGILMTALEVVFFLFTGLFSINYIKDLNTLGTVQYEAVFDPLTMKNTVNDYDNSLLILLYGIVGILVILAFILLYISNMKAVYRLQLMNPAQRRRGGIVGGALLAKPQRSLEGRRRTFRYLYRNNRQSSSGIF